MLGRRAIITAVDLVSQSADPRASSLRGHEVIDSVAAVSRSVMSSFHPRRRSVARSILVGAAAAAGNNRPAAGTCAGGLPGRVPYRFTIDRRR